MCRVQKHSKVGAVSVVFTANDKGLVEQKIHELAVDNPNNYYIVYSVPLNVDLTELTHFPSVAITKGDLE